MKRKFLHFVVLLLALFLFGFRQGQDHLVSLRYYRTTRFPSLQKKLGPVLGIAPFRDDRPEKQYIGSYALMQYRYVPSYFRSDPFPLEKALQEAFSEAVSRSGVRAVSLPDWDGKADSLEKMGVDSVLKIDTKRFWIEGRDVSARANMHISIHLTVHLGVKSEGRVFSRDVYVERNRTFSRMTPQGLEQRINRILANLIEDFLRDPYWKETS
jgi:hypothetical protein